MVKSTAPDHGNPDTYSSTYTYAGTHNDAGTYAITYAGTHTYTYAYAITYAGTHHDTGTYAITYAGTYSNAGSRPDANTYSRAFACSGHDDYTITATGAALRTFHREDRLRV